MSNVYPFKNISGVYAFSASASSSNTAVQILPLSGSPPYQDYMIENQGEVVAYVILAATQALANAMTVPSIGVPGSGLPVLPGSSIVIPGPVQAWFNAQSVVDTADLIVCGGVGNLSAFGTSSSNGGVPGGGTVTSVNVSGGTTGLTTSGGPVTNAGTITLGGTLAVANGGTGSTTPTGAVTNLGLNADAGAAQIGTSSGNNAQVELNLKPTVVASRAALLATPTTALPGGNIQLQSYNAGQNQGGGPLVYIASSGTADDVYTFNDASGALYRRTDPEIITLQKCGGPDADGVTDIQPAVARAYAAGVKELLIPAVGTLTYKCNNKCSIGNMAVLIAEQVTIDGTGAFTGNYVMEAKGSLVAVAQSLSVAPTVGDLQLTFSAPPASLAIGDIFCLFDPGVLWNAARPYYYTGEWCEVADIVGNVVSLTEPLWDSYNIATGTFGLYRMPKLEASIRGGTIVSGTQFGAVNFSLCTKADLFGTKVRSSGLATSSSVNFDRCIRFATDEHVKVSNYGLTNVSGNAYALTIGNSQHGRIMGGNYYGQWIGIALGGASTANDATYPWGFVPCRDVFAIGATMTSNTKLVGVSAANFHGNCEACEFVSCFSSSGYILAGKNTFARNCTGGSNSVGTCVTVAEIKGGSIGAIGGSYRTYTNPQASSRAIFDFGTNGGGPDANMTEDFTMVVRDLKLYGRNLTSSTYFVGFKNTGTTLKVSSDIRGINFDVNALGSALLCTATTGGGVAASNGFIVDELFNYPAGSTYVSLADANYRAFPQRLPVQSGVITGLNTVASPVINTASAVTFGNSYGTKVPAQITLQVTGAAGASAPTLAGQTPTCRPFNTTGALMSVQLANVANVNFTAAVAYELKWSVGVREC